MSAVQNLIEAALDALDFADDQSDVVDGPDGAPEANDAMQLSRSLSAAIQQVGGADGARVADAAPEMRDALQAMLHEFGRTYLPGSSPAVDAARAALLKAGVSTCTP